MHGLAHRRAGVGALAACAAVLAGCVSVSPPAAVEPTRSASPVAESPTPSSAPTIDSDGRPERLSFAAGESLDPAVWTVVWVDAIPGRGAFSVKSADDGNGSWSYTHDETECEATFYQGAMGGVDMSQHDRAISDEYLGVILSGIGGDAADVAEYGVTDEVRQPLERGTVDVRMIGAELSDGGTWIHMARMFGALGGGVTLDIRCPRGQDAWAAYELIVSTYVSIMIADANA